MKKLLLILFVFAITFTSMAINKTSSNEDTVKTKTEVVKNDSIAQVQVIFRANNLIVKTEMADSTKAQVKSIIGNIPEVAIQTKKNN